MKDEETDLLIVESRKPEIAQKIALDIVAALPPT
jgi:hypothetical protein